MVDTALAQHQQQQALLLEPTPDLVGQESWVVHNGEKKTIGRKVECDIVVNDTIVSGQHCTVGLSILSTQERQGDGIVISVEDKSTNGTLINGEKVGKGKTRYAQVGDVISLGKPKMTSQGEHCYAASYKLRMVMLDSMGRWQGEQEKENIKNANSEVSSTDAPVGSPRSAVHSEAITTREALGSVPRLRNFPVNGKRAREPPTGARRREGKTSSAAAMAAAHREEQLRAQLASVEEARRKEESRATELEIRVRVNEERLRALTEQLEEARKGKDRFQAENADLQNQIAELTIRGKQLEAAAESKERAWQDSQREAGMRNEEMESLRAEAYEAAARARDVTRRLRDVKRSYDTTVEANRKLMEYSTELKERVDGLQAALVTSSSSVGALQNAIQHLFDVSREHDGQETAKIASLLRPVSSPPQGLPVGIASTDQQTYVEEEEDQTDTDDEVETLLTNAATLEENGEVTPRPIDRIRVKQSDSDSDTSGQDGTETPPPLGKRTRSCFGGTPSSQKRLRRDGYEEEEKADGGTFGSLLDNAEK